jgi:hypothetical protein
VQKNLDLEISILDLEISIPEIENSNPDLEKNNLNFPSIFVKNFAKKSVLKNS